MTVDLGLVKLQYEILNVSIEDLAAALDMSPKFFLEEIKGLGWKRMWEDEDEPHIEIDEDEDRFTIETEAYIEKTRKRLMAYSLAKEIYLSQKYLELESGIINKAASVLSTLDVTDPQNLPVESIRKLATLYKDMTKSQVAANATSSISLGTDDQGLPTLIVRDLSGKKTNEKK